MSVKKNGRQQESTNILAFFPKLIFFHEHYRSFRHSVQHGFAQQNKKYSRVLEFLFYTMVTERGKASGYYLLTKRQFWSFTIHRQFMDHCKIMTEASVQLCYKNCNSHNRSSHFILNLSFLHQIDKKNVMIAISVRPLVLVGNFYFSLILGDTKEANCWTTARN